MNNDDLIERLEAEFRAIEQAYPKRAKLLRDTIAALSPALPDEIAAVCREARSKGLTRTADAIERLARENGLYAHEVAEQKKEVSHWMGKAEEHMARIDELEGSAHSCGPNCQRPLCVANRRIEELEAQHDIAYANDPKLWDRLKKAHAKIAEYEKALETQAEDFRQKGEHKRAGDLQYKLERIRKL